MGSPGIKLKILYLNWRTKLALKKTIFNRILKIAPKAEYLNIFTENNQTIKNKKHNGQEVINK